MSVMQSIAIYIISLHMSISEPTRQYECRLTHSISGRNVAHGGTGTLASSNIRFMRYSRESVEM